MADYGTEFVDLNTDRGTRQHIESAVAEVAPHHPVVGPLVDRAVEEHAREIKKQNDVATPADRKDKLRATIRASIDQVKQKANTPQLQKSGQIEAAKGPPIQWTDESKSAWDNLPSSVRTDLLREQNSMMENVLPRLKAHAEIEQVVSAHKDLLPAGIKAAEVLGNALQWLRGLHGPNKVAYLNQLMSEAGISPLDVVNGGQQHYPQQYQSTDPETQRAYQELHQKLSMFAQDKPAFQAVRYRMGELLRDNEARYTQANGETNLDLLYHDAVQQHQSPGSGPEAQVAETIMRFSQGKKDFPAVRHSMGLLLSAHPERYAQPDGSCNLDKLYRDAMKADGISADGKNSKRAAISPSGRSPSGAPVDTSKATGIRASIKRAIAESRGTI